MLLLHMSLSHIAAWWLGSKKEGREQKQPGLFRIELRSSLPPYSTGQSSHRASSGSRGGEESPLPDWEQGNAAVTILGKFDGPQGL